MARTRSPAIAQRDQNIYIAWRDGATLHQLAERHDLTPQRIGQIVAARHPEHEDITGRALHRGRLENLISELQGVAARPGWKLTPRGDIAVDDEGTPIEDTQAKIEALKVLLAALESARKLDGLNKPEQRTLTVELGDAQRAMLADIDRRRRMLQGEVVREIMPPHPSP